MTNKELLIGLGTFATGVLLGVVFMMNNYPNTYLGKTAQQWNEAYAKAQEVVDTHKQAAQLPDPYQGLVQCLRNMNRYTDYYRGNGYYVNDVSDVNQCIEEAQQQYYDNSSQMLNQRQ